MLLVSLALELGAAVKAAAGIFIGKKPTALLSKTDLRRIEGAGLVSVSRRESAARP
jgi:hypothetical protein